MVTPLVQESFTLGDVQLKPCPFCGSLNLPEPDGRAACCDPSPAHCEPEWVLQILGGTGWQRHLDRVAAYEADAAVLLARFGE